MRSPLNIVLLRKTRRQTPSPRLWLGRGFSTPPSMPEAKKATTLKGPRPFSQLAQEEGFEPPTSRLTAGCSTTELLLNGGIPGIIESQVFV